MYSPVCCWRFAYDAVPRRWNRLLLLPAGQLKNVGLPDTILVGLVDWRFDVAFLSNARSLSLRLSVLRISIQRCSFLNVHGIVLYSI